MPKTIRTAALVLTLMAVAGCRLYDHARHVAVHAIVSRSMGALQPLTQSTYRPAPLHETITVTAKAPVVAEIDPAPEALPVARSLASVGDGPGVRMCTRPLPRFADLVRIQQEIIRCRITIDAGREIVIDTSSL
jgi:hypothetical protein